MKDINEILKGGDISNIINELKKQTFFVPEWSVLLKDYEPKFHAITKDKKGRKDKVHKDGSVDKAARIPIGMEKLLTKRITEFTFAIPVKRIYSNIEKDKMREIADSIESVYRHAHINTENIKRGNAYYASCEIFTLWYTVPKENDLYGFKTPRKLKCKTYSPMDGDKLFPLFDELGDMIAMSIEYDKKEENELVTYFETYTAENHYIWKRGGKAGEWQEVETAQENTIGKIPGTYLCRPQPIFDGLQALREDMEYTISRNSDIVAYNAAPVLKVSGQLIGDENKGETRRVYRVAEGGDVSYVSWAQSTEALSYHVNTLVKYFWMQSQMPDISFENMKSLGNIGYDSRRTLLTDAHLKIGEESGPWMEFLSRECNVIKAFLKQMNISWASEIDDLDVEHIITPFIIEDEQAQIDMHMKANGGKPVESQHESIQRIGKSKNVDETIRQINEEAAQQASLNTSVMADMFSAE